jgi:hypothetical protein
MLSGDLARHVALHEALGFRFRTQRLLLRNFVAFAERRGDRFIGAHDEHRAQRRSRLATGHRRGGGV